MMTATPIFIWVDVEMTCMYYHICCEEHVLITTIYLVIYLLFDKFYN